jgi:two-component system nitrate/nitrite response regulator NarL
MGLNLKKSVAICETQPVTAAGVRGIIESSADLEFAQWLDSLAGASELLMRRPPDILLIDKAFGIQAILDWLGEVQVRRFPVAPVVWSVSMTEAEALRFLQAGARGIVRKTADVAIILSCLRAVGAGRTWMEDSVFRQSMHPERYPRSELTPREQQVLELVEQGFKNREIAIDLGIRPGTVKIHLKHIFEKTGVRGRYGLALNGLRHRGVLSLTA